MEPLEQSEAHKQETHTREDMEIEHWRTVYQEVRRAYDFLVDTVNFQQQRIANVLLTNSLILGFLGTIAVIFLEGPGPRVSSYLYVASLCFLALGLVAAAVALWPTISPRSENLFLKPPRILEQGRKLSEAQHGTQQLLERLSESIVDNAEKTQHTEVVNRRRFYIRIQLTCVLGGLILLVVALITHLFMS
ncbi:MAG TPA: hypothetical protein VKB35_10890 [Ktedonobacteraceae bacterium]|nr:hypothetical protein [Ktedonobacteraceae bacterium]